MDRSDTAQFVLLIAAAITCSLSLVAHALQPQPADDNFGSSSCRLHERDALLAFKQGITSDPAGLLVSWQQQGGPEELDCCRWRGVRCSNMTGHVLKIQLRNEHTAGVYTYRRPVTPLVGQISPSLVELEHLEHLDLSMNYLEGTSGRLPDFLGSFKNLKYLNLSFIPFSSRVPSQLGNLSRLQYLDLSGLENAYATDTSWLARLSYLQHLDLSSVNLRTVANWPQAVSRIPSLRILHLSNCSLASANQSLPSHRNLTNLEDLDLSDNYFNHPIESCWFWNLTRLKYLNVANTNMYGQLPNALGSMVTLQFLDLSSNKINLQTTNMKDLCSLRILHIEFCLADGNITELIENLPQCSSNELRELHLSSNNLTGLLPNSMAHLKSLVTLDLSSNKISGPLHESIGQLANLVILDLSWNNFTGHLPPSIGEFTRLGILDLSYNNLAGHVPYEIGMLTELTKLCLNNNDLDGVITEDHFAVMKSLQYVDLSYNSLRIRTISGWKPPFRLSEAYFVACQMGPLFPAWLQWQVNISYLDISSTGIVDRLPQWFSKAFSKYKYLNISNNQLYGGLPMNMDTMSLEGLYLSSNQLTGQIPTLPPNLTFLDIAMNFLSGPLPSDIEVPKLGELSLFSNSITGRIPESICKCKGLVTLDLSNNSFEGELPLCSGMKDIAFLDLSNNSFSGRFPYFVANCTSMKLLDLSRNEFSGRLPAWIGNLASLRLLRLSHNKFNGNIPVNITSLVCLQYMDISNSGISGSLPRYLSNFKAMRQTYLLGNLSTDIEHCFNGDLHEFHLVNLIAVMKGQELNHGSIRRIFDSNMISIDLSENDLTGEIPDEIITLDAMMNLNISRNHFSGSIPQKIGALLLMESLDLSRNELSGEIPASLSNLTFLSYLDLSYNDLTGRIPPGQQLDTLYAENPTIYNGNVGLCGSPLLHKNCPSDNATRYGRMRIEDGGSWPDLFYIGSGCGFSFGLLVVFCALLFKKRWRIAYFVLLDKLPNSLCASCFLDNTCQTN